MPESRPARLLLVLAVFAGVAAACGNDTFGTVTDPYCYTVTLDDSYSIAGVVPPGQSVLLMEQGDRCTLTLATACNSGDCSGIVVTVAGREIAVPGQTLFDGTAVGEVRAVNRSANPGTVAIAQSGVCERCMVFR